MSVSMRLFTVLDENLPKDAGSRPRVCNARSLGLVCKRRAFGYRKLGFSDQMEVPSRGDVTDGSVVNRGWSPELLGCSRSQTEPLCFLSWAHSTVMTERGQPNRSPPSSVFQICMEYGHVLRRKRHRISELVASPYHLVPTTLGWFWSRNEH